jgi:hypothetical protein
MITPQEAFDISRKRRSVEKNNNKGKLKRIREESEGPISEKSSDSDSEESASQKPSSVSRSSSTESRISRYSLTPSTSSRTTTRTRSPTVESGISLQRHVDSSRVHESEELTSVKHEMDEESLEKEVSELCLPSPYEQDILERTSFNEFILPLSKIVSKPSQKRWSRRSDRAEEDALYNYMEVTQFFLNIFLLTVEF